MKPLQVSVAQQGRLSLIIPEKSTENNFPILFFPTEFGFLFQGLLSHQVKRVGFNNSFFNLWIQVKSDRSKVFTFFIAILGYEHKILRYLFIGIILFSEVVLINYFM